VCDDDDDDDDDGRRYVELRRLAAVRLVIPMMRSGLQKQAKASRSSAAVVGDAAVRLSAEVSVGMMAAQQDGGMRMRMRMRMRNANAQNAAAIGGFAWWG
jgi:hypothetical protein